MSSQSFQETLAVQRAAGTLFTTYTAAKSVINPAALYTAPANWLVPGRRLRAVIRGAISNIVTTPGLFNLQVKVGGVAAFDTGNIQLNATAHTTLPFWAEIGMTVRAEGNATSANLIGLCNISGLMITRTAGQTDDAQGVQTLLAPATAPAVGSGYDSTIGNVIDLWAGFTISNVGNGIQIQEYTLEALN